MTTLFQVPDFEKAPPLMNSTFCRELIVHSTNAPVKREPGTSGQIDRFASGGCLQSTLVVGSVAGHRDAAADAVRVASNGAIGIDAAVEDLQKLVGLNWRDWPSEVDGG